MRTALRPCSAYPQSLTQRRQQELTNRVSTMEQIHGSQTLKAKGALCVSGSLHQTCGPTLYPPPVHAPCLSRIQGKQGRCPSTAYHPSQSWQNLPGVF